MNRHAILIANCTFPRNQGLHTLELPRNDQEKLKKHLSEVKNAPFSIASLLDASAVEITDAITEVIRDSKFDDLVLIHYSGHGLTNPGASALSLAAYDTNDKRNPLREVQFQAIASLVHGSGRKRVLILLDCCHSGAAGSQGPCEIRGTIEPEVAELALTQLGFETTDDYDDEIRGDAGSVLKENEDGHGVYVMTACSPNQNAVGKNGYGLFTYQVIEAIKENLNQCGSKTKPLTVRSLYSAVRQGLKDTAQTPMLFVRGGQTSDDMVIIPAGLPYQRQVPDELERFEWQPLTVREFSQLRQVAPVYLLSSKFAMKDWNGAFEHLIARQCKLSRGQHAGDFLKCLNNQIAVNERASKVFIEPAYDENERCDKTGEIAPSFPKVDIEQFDYKSDRYGYIRFDKIATQIIEPGYAPKTWCVNLSVNFCERADVLWEKLKEVAMRDVSWSKYAESYDDIIGEYPEYQKLVDLVVSQIGKSEVCLDLGAGTGNTTLALHRKAKLGGFDRLVTAIDTNEEMLARLIKKLEKKDERLKTKVVKGDALGYLRNLAKERETREENKEFLDACVMLNVLFVLDEPIACLEAIRTVLKPGGILSLSTPRRGTDIHRLFRSIKAHLESINSFAVKQQGFDAAYDRNKELIQYATKDTLDNIRGYLVQAGFEIEHEQDHQYDDCVIVIKAKKPKVAAGRKPK